MTDSRQVTREDVARYEGRVEAFDAIMAYVREVNGNGVDEPHEPAFDAVWEKAKDLRSRATAARRVTLDALPATPAASAEADAEPHINDERYPVRVRIIAGLMRGGASVGAANRIVERLEAAIRAEMDDWWGPKYRELRSRSTPTPPDAADADEIDTLAWLVWFARKVRGTARAVAYKAWEQNPDLRRSTPTPDATDAVQFPDHTHRWQERSQAALDAEYNETGAMLGRWYCPGCYTETDVEPDSVRLDATDAGSRESVLREHRLSFPPHADGFYATSALCSCNTFQWDGPSGKFVVQAAADVWADWWDHVLAAAGPSTPTTEGLDAPPLPILDCGCGACERLRELQRRRYAARLSEPE